MNLDLSDMGDGMIVLITKFSFNDGKDRNYVLDFLEDLSASNTSIAGYEFDVLPEYVESKQVGISPDREQKKLTNRSKHSSHVLCSEGINPAGLTSIPDLELKWTTNIVQRYTTYVRTTTPQIFCSDWERTVLQTKPIFHPGCLNVVLSDKDAALLLIRYYNLQSMDECDMENKSGEKILTFAFGQHSKDEKEFLIKTIGKLE